MQLVWERTKQCKRILLPGDSFIQPVSNHSLLLVPADLSWSLLRHVTPNAKPNFHALQHQCFGSARASSLCPIILAHSQLCACFSFSPTRSILPPPSTAQPLVELAWRRLLQEGLFDYSRLYSPLILDVCCLPPQLPFPLYVPPFCLAKLVVPRVPTSPSALKVGLETWAEPISASNCVDGECGSW